MMYWTYLKLRSEVEKLRKAIGANDPKEIQERAAQVRTLAGTIFLQADRKPETVSREEEGITADPRPAAVC